MAGFPSSQDEARSADMPYLLYPPNSAEAAKPTYAISYPNSVDETILQDLRRWGWRIEETTRTDPVWLSTVKEYQTRMQRPSEEDGVTWPSLWDYWRGEKVRSTSLGGNTITGSHKSSLSSSTSGNKFYDLPVDQETTHDKVGNEEEAKVPSVPDRQSKTIAQLKQETEQKKETSEDWNAPNPAKSLGELDPDHSGIYNYGDEGLTRAENKKQLDRELLQDLKDWPGTGGILKTTQVSVHSDYGICVDEKGNRAVFPPEHHPPLFKQEEEASRMSSTKSDELPERNSFERRISQIQRFMTEGSNLRSGGRSGSCDSNRRAKDSKGDAAMK